MPCKSGALSPPSYYRGRWTLDLPEEGRRVTLTEPCCPVYISNPLLHSDYQSPTTSETLHLFPLLSNLCPLYCTRTYRRQLHAYFLIRKIHDLNISTRWHFPFRLVEERRFRRIEWGRSDTSAITCSRELYIDSNNAPVD